MTDQDANTARLRAMETELTRDRVVARVERTIWQMASDDDIEHVSACVREALAELGIAYRNCEVNLLDDLDHPGHVVSHGMRGGDDWQDTSEHDAQSPVIDFWREGKVVYRSDLAADDRYNEEHLRSVGVRSVIDLPFSHGTLAINSTEPNAFQPEDIEALEMLAQVLSVAFTRAQDLRSLRERNQALADANQLLRNMHEISRLSASSLDQQQILDALGRQLVDMGVFRSITVSLVDDSAGRVVVVGIFRRGRDQPRQDAAQHIWYDLGDRDILAECARTGQTQIIAGWDERFTPNDRNTPASRQGQVAYFIPIKAHDKVMAVIATGSTMAEQERTTQRLTDLQPLWDQAAAALSNAALFESAQKEIDQRKRAEEELAQAHRQRDADNAIRLVAASIKEPQDLEAVLAEVSKQLTDLGVMHHEISLQIMNATGTSFFTMGPAASAAYEWNDVWDQYISNVRDGHIWFPREDDDSLSDGLRRERETIIEVWKNGTFRYEPCTPEGLGEVPPGIAMLDVAFSHGTLAINNRRPHAFGDGDVALLQHFAAIVSESFERFLHAIQHRLAAEAMVQSESKYRELFENMHDGFALHEIVQDEKGHVVDYVFLELNDAFERLTGLRREAVVGRRATDVLPGIQEDPTDWIGRYGRVAITGVPSVFESRSASLERWYQVTSYSPTEGQFAVVFSDITERKQAEERLILLERHSAATDLAAGISHNLNNVLTAVLGPAQLLLRKNGDPLVSEEAGHILAAGIRARDLVRRLSDSIRPAVDAHESVELNQLVQETVELARPRWKDEPEARGVVLRVVTELGEIPPVRGNTGELSELLLNLLLNAVDAMPEGGTITFATNLEAQDGFVCLTVSDTGTGMAEETRRRVFEPFFTTKTDVGSGLGLSTAHGSVTRAGGTMKVESEPGRGTTFTICLPVSEDERQVEGVGAVTHPVRSGSILLVEDDAMVCEAVQRLLSDRHRVEVAHDGMDAMQRFSPGHFDVALIDLGIPMVPGDRVAADLRERDPSVVTVLFTGWGLAEDDPRLSSFDFYLQKPLVGSELDEIIAQAMALHNSRT